METDKIPSKMRDKRLRVRAMALGCRVLCIALSVIFFALYSKVIFVLFMGHEGFFSYDFFATGTAGLEVFFFTTELMLLFFAVSTLGALIPIFKYLLKRKFTKNDLCLTVWFLIVNIFSWTVIFDAIAPAPSDKQSAWIVLLALSLVICFHLAVLFYRQPKDGLRSLVTVLIVLMGMTTIAHAQMVTLLQIGLKHFGVGGGIPVTIETANSENDRGIIGKLMLLSPENVYVVLDDDRELSIIPRSIATVIKVSSRRSIP